MAFDPLISKYLFLFKKCPRYETPTDSIIQHLFMDSKIFISKILNYVFYNINILYDVQSMLKQEVLIDTYNYNIIIIRTLPRILKIKRTLVDDKVCGGGSGIVAVEDFMNGSVC